MKCPVCESKLISRELGGVQVDICESGCAGIWFDHREILKFDEPHEAHGEKLIAVKHDPAKTRNHKKQISCPRCPRITLMRRYYSIKREVEIDECAKCGGIWLDQGELEKIRSQYKTEEDRRKAAEQLFDELVRSHTAEEAAKTKQSLESAQRFANFFRFICPSNYIPGKQKGGAF